MASFNKVILMGNLTRDPEVRRVSTGNAVTDLGLAVNRQYRTSSGENVEEVVFVSVDVWGRQAETCGEYLKKGSPVLVEGRLKLDTWEKDGKKMSKLGVVAERVQFLGSPRRGGMDDGPGDAYSGGGGGESRASSPSPAPDREFSGDDDENIPF